MFDELQNAIIALNDDAIEVSSVLDALRINYVRHEKLYTYSIEVWYQVNDKTMTVDDMLALMALLTRLTLASKLTHNDKFLILRVSLYEHIS